MLEYVQLAVHCPRPIRHGDQVGIVDAPVGPALEQPRADGHPVLPRELHEVLGARTVRNRLGERLERLARELAHMPVAREAHLGERDDLHARADGLRHEVSDAPEVVRLVARGVLKLDSRHADVAHTAAWFRWRRRRSPCLFTRSGKQQETAVRITHDEGSSAPGFGP